MLIGTAPRRVVIVGGIRIPFARSHGAYAGQSNQDLLTAALRALVERFRLRGERLGDVIGGAVIKHSRDFNLVRESLTDGNDASWLRAQRGKTTPMPAVVEAAAARWMG